MILMYVCTFFYELIVYMNQNVPVTTGPEETILHWSGKI